MKRIGLLSDTHSYFDTRFLELFKDVDEIWHAGDIGDIKVLDELRRFKPVKAVYEGKTEQPAEKVVESLKNLKAEIVRRTEKYDDPTLREMFFKINSCLYSEYPHSFQRKEK